MDVVAKPNFHVVHKETVARIVVARCDDDTPSCTDPKDMALGMGNEDIQDTHWVRICRSCVAVQQARMEILRVGSRWMGVIRRSELELKSVI